MNELELLQQISDKRNEIERNRDAKVSKSLLKLQEEELKELEYIWATGDQNRMEMRFFLDQCDKSKDQDEQFGDEYDDVF